jgi:citrate/tricarballylate utilization protein
VPPPDAWSAPVPAPAIASPDAAPSPNEAEVAREMRICNACRYCEGFCAVFPAMTRRLEFARGDVDYLANLCHNCGACYYACQYAPPHEFAVNVPQAMARVRRETYTKYAWPARFGALYQRNGLAVALALAGGLALFVFLAMARMGTLIAGPLAGDFYAVFPHGLLVALFTGAFGYAILALAIGVARFWRGDATAPATLPAVAESAANALRLTYLDGGHGDGCNESDDRFTLVRRRFHHLTFYGFMLCFAATVTATFYHYVLGRSAPYPIVSLPVALGTLGGIGLLIGPAGLLWLNVSRNPATGDSDQYPLDRGFIALLLLSSASGLALLAWRDSATMSLLAAVHFGVVLALFMTMPYGKFVHGVYRGAALLKWSIERRQPNPNLLKDD